MRALPMCPLIATALILTTCWAHMEMASPPPRRSKYNPFTPGSQIDYSMTSPLLADGSNFPCKGYPPGKIVKVVKAGSTLRVTMAGTIFHAGGHCQWLVSYDGGKTFVALKTVLNNCFTGTGLKINVPFPKNLPPCEHCVFAWTWINAIGNREFYMNCADIGISSSSKGRFTGPAMVVANLPGYPTVPEFRADLGKSAGTDLFSKAGKVTVGGESGSVGRGPSVPGRNASPPAKPRTPPPPQSKPPKPTGRSGGQCTIGYMKCSGPMTYTQCAPAAGGGGQWSAAVSCAPGTKCSPNKNYITCK